MHFPQHLVQYSLGIKRLIWVWQLMEYQELTRLFGENNQLRKLLFIFSPELVKFNRVDLTCADYLP